MGLESVNMILRKYFLLAMFSFCSYFVIGQDIHFSQFYMSPLTLNPALTGVMNCNVRMTANYRNQWASVLKSNSYNTYSVAYDQKIPVGRADYFGIGGLLYSDVAGALNFGTIKGQLSASFSKKMGGGRGTSHYLSVGADAGLAQRRIDFANARWGDQHDGQGGFSGETSQEDLLNNFDKDNFIFADMSVGILWFTVLNKNTSFYGGAALSHLNQPNQSFVEGEFISLYSKYTAHAGGEFGINDKFSVLPGAVYLKQGPSYEINGGTSIKFNLDPNTNQSFQFGGWVRIANHFSDNMTMDAIIFSTKFDHNNFGIGFSYDINVSPLKQASNSNGAFEFSLVYTICGSENRGVYCPNF